MNFENYDYDYSCRACGRGYYADVGQIGSPCCGIEKEIAADKKREKEAKEKRKPVKYSYIDEDLDIQMCDDEREF